MALICICYLLVLLLFADPVLLGTSIHGDMSALIASIILSKNATERRVSQFNNVCQV